MKEKIVMEGLTFDDVLLIPQYSEILPSEVDVSTRLTNNIRLKTPVVSAAMDTVTEAQMAIALALEGGIGIVHKNMTIQEQVEQVKKVKRYENWIITNPVTVFPQTPIVEALALMQQYDIAGLPVLEGENLVGLVTSRDFRFLDNDDGAVQKIMTPREDLITAHEGISMDEAQRVLHRHRIEKLPVVDEKNRLVGLITYKDIQKNIEFPDAAKDRYGRLLVGAAVGVGSDYRERAYELADADVDVLVIDTAHGHSIKVAAALSILRKELPQVDLIVGNVATGEATQMLIDHGANAVKVGIGPGSICTTRVVAGVGVPQLSAIMECAKVADRHNIPIIADGGIKYSGDIAKAIAGGASTVMLGNLLAGTEESPGELVLYEGRRFKSYRGMGSIGAMKKGSKDRYFQETVTNFGKLVAEGIEGMVAYKGTLNFVTYQLVGGLKAAMGYCGVASIDEMRCKSKFIRVTQASLQESHPHDITITKEAPNYMHR